MFAFFSEGTVRYTPLKASEKSVQSCRIELENRYRLGSSHTCSQKLGFAQLLPEAANNKGRFLNTPGKNGSKNSEGNGELPRRWILMNMCCNECERIKWLRYPSNFWDRDYIQKLIT